MSKERIYVKSLAEFLEAVLSKIDNLNVEGPKWFRGEASENFKLVPNIYRVKAENDISYCTNIGDSNRIRAFEQNIDVSFFRKSIVYFSSRNIESNPWNRYFLKQHYGVKTRLLDWTENAILALYFSVTSCPSSIINPKVYILSPAKLNNFSVSHLESKLEKFHGIFTCGKLQKKRRLFSKKKNVFRPSELLRKYYRLDCNHGEQLYPIAVYPPHLDERMSAQQACFTLFGNIVEEIEETGSKEGFLESIYIDGPSKQSILKQLRIIGISDYSVKPDLDGLGEAINKDVSNELGLIQEQNEIINYMKNMKTNS